MSQQELEYNELNHDRSGISSGTHGGSHHYHTYGDRDKLSAPLMRTELTAGQRLALAIVSLAMMMIMTFGLVGIAVATNAAGWVVLPILFILALFATAAVIINIVFNRKP
jgi:fatty acid desaturase